jgi:hypothetical protein
MSHLAWKSGTKNNNKTPWMVLTQGHNPAETSTAVLLKAIYQALKCKKKKKNDDSSVQTRKYLHSLSREGWT